MTGKQFSIIWLILIAIAFAALAVYAFITDPEKALETAKFGGWMLLGGLFLIITANALSELDR